MTQRRRLRASVAAAALILCPSVLQAGATVDLALEDAASIHGSFGEEQFGYCVTTGDLDGDGAEELVVGAPGFADSTEGKHTGAVFVFRASAIDTLSTGARASDLAAWTILGDSALGRFGSAVAAGDLDGDGFDDLAVGAPDAGDETGITRGEVTVYFGGPSRPRTRSLDAAPDAVLTGASAGGRLGSFMLARDINGDGDAELLISEPGGDGPGGRRSGAVHVVEGAALRSHPGASPVSEIAAATIGGEGPGDALAGLAVADTNGDGVAELILGAPQGDGQGADVPDAGRLYVVPAQAVFGQHPDSIPIAARLALTGATARGFLGGHVSAGDIDYDGLDDILISAYASRAGGERLEATGEVFVIFGSPGETSGGEVSARVVDDPAVPRLHGATASDLFGLPVLLADLNGDRAADIIAAAQYADGPDDGRNACGEVYVYWGSLRSVMAAKAGSAERADVTVVGPFAEDSIGGALAVVRSSEGGPPTLFIGAPDAAGADRDGRAVQRCGKLLLVRGESLLR